VKTHETDIFIVGAGPVGLMCAYLANLCGLNFKIADKSKSPIDVGRADALNARSLQLLEIARLFNELYPMGKPCNTSSIWSKGAFLSRQSAWWDELEGCFHKHFLMLGQSFIEKALDEKLNKSGHSVQREAEVKDIEIVDDQYLVTLSNGDLIKSKYLIGTDGSRSFVRQRFQVPFQITRPKIIWAVVDGVIETDFPKVPEIIVFQNETSDVAWIPREGKIDRFYVQMESKDFSFKDALVKIKKALEPREIIFKEIIWFSQFSVKESVAEKFCINNQIFLAGDSCHIHSVNGGQGLNTGLGDAFNLIWKLNMVIKHNVTKNILSTYEEERKPVAMSVVETSGELVRATKFSKEGTHAKDYVEIIQRRSGHITGMGIRYGDAGLRGQRLFDFEVIKNQSKTRIYSLLDYTKFTLLVFSEVDVEIQLPEFVQMIHIYPNDIKNCYWTTNKQYNNQIVLVRPDSYIEDTAPAFSSEQSIKNIIRCCLDARK